MALGFFPSSDDPTQPDSYDALQRKRKLAETMLAQGMSTAPIQHWTQGLARLAQAGVGAYRERQIDQQEKASSASFNDLMAKALGMGGSSGAATGYGSPTVPAEMPGGKAPSLGPIGEGSPASAPDALRPHFEAASKATGIPVSVLIAQATQESRMNPNAVGKAGEVGLTQIMPSTARDPGFGMQGVDPASLRDPAANVMFGAQYLAARGKAAGISDWNDPQQVAKALRAYNGGGDPNYVANVMRYMPAQAAINQAAPQQVASNAPGLGYAPQPPLPTGPIEAAPLPAPGGPDAPLSNFPAIPGSTPTLPSGGFSGPVGAQPEQPARTIPAAPAIAGVNPDAPAPGAAPAGPAPMTQPMRLATAISGGAPQQADYSRMLLAAAMNPALSPAQRQQAVQVATFLQGQNQTKQVDLGDRVVLLDKNNNIVGNLPKSRDSADWEVKTDADGTPIGKFNKRSGEFVDMRQGGGAPSLSRADGTPIDLPPGTNMAEARKEVTKSNTQEILGAPKAFDALQQSYQSIAGLLDKSKGIQDLTSWLGFLREKIPGSDAKAARLRLDQIVGQNFLNAYNQLRGGGQITEVEGRKAQDAMARLADPAVGEGEFRSALKDLHDVIRGGMTKLKGLPGMDKYQVPPELSFAKPGAKQQAAPQSGDVARPQSKAEFDALPSGTPFVDPNGIKRIKP